jgi:hypothetical protein
VNDEVRERIVVLPPRRAKGASSWSSPIRVRTRSGRGMSARRRKHSTTRMKIERQLSERGAAPKKPPA